jgi:MoaA/NifB/PqqE/SkfB family radical SAM enzyme
MRARRAPRSVTDRDPPAPPIPPPSDWARHTGLIAGLFRSRILTGRPFFLAHAATFGCNSRCQTCSYWKLTPRMKEDLSTEGVYALLDEAYAAGMRGYYLFGGEPLIRKDIGLVVDRARERGFVTCVNTNGSLLAAKAASLKGLDVAFVSLDYYNDYHDTIRGHPGNFAQVMRGVDRIRSVAGAKVTLVTTISTLNGVEAMEPMARLAQQLGVGISFNSIEPTLDFGLTDSDRSPNLRLGLPPEGLRSFYATGLRLKQAGYPLMETEEVLRGYVEGRPWKCEFDKMFVYVTPDKRIYSCDYAYGYDLRHGSFEEYFSSAAFRAHVRSIASCNRCVRTCVRNYAYTYQLKPFHLVHLIRNAASLYRPPVRSAPVPTAAPPAFPSPS